MKYIRLLDTTLREGMQSSVGFLLLGNEIKFLKLLDKIGIDFIEYIHPYSSSHNLKTFSKIKKINLKAKLFVHSSPNKQDFNLLIDNDFKNISTFIEAIALMRV